MKEKLLEALTKWQEKKNFPISDDCLGEIIEIAYGIAQSKIDLVIAERDKEIVEINENTSDGYHTFKELYEYRKIYNALAFNEWAKQGIYNVHKSKRHSDGELCCGWFIVVAELPTGQISNHYELKDWDLFKCEEKQLPNQYDGHSPQDVTERIINLINNTKTDKQ